MLLSTLIAQAGSQFGEGLQDPSSLFESDSATGNQSLTNLETFISRVIGFLTVLAGVFFILYFVLGAFRWVSSGGDSGTVEKARNQMTQGIIGLVLVVMSYGIIGVVGTLVGINILTPAVVLEQVFGL